MRFPKSSLRRGFLSQVIGEEGSRRSLKESKGSKTEEMKPSKEVISTDVWPQADHTGRDGA